MKYLILGSKGQLAKEFLKKISDKIFAYDIDTLDIADENLLKRVIDFVKPDFIINCAAYNNVDKAEKDYQTAFRINAEAVKNMALFSKKYKTKVVHFSSDYVFPGKFEKVPYTEKDIPAPINKYGLTKLEGENLLKSISDNFLIFRVSWLYGDGTQNFPYKLLLWLKNKAEIKVSTDEISVPTPANFVANTVIKALKSDLKGAWHLCPSGFCSRYDWALVFSHFYDGAFRKVSD